jgi:hypothetical protein
MNYGYTKKFGFLDSLFLSVALFLAFLLMLYGSHMAFCDEEESDPIYENEEAASVEEDAAEEQANEIDFTSEELNCSGFPKEICDRAAFDSVILFPHVFQKKEYFANIEEDAGRSSIGRFFHNIFNKPWTDRVFDLPLEQRMKFVHTGKEGDLVGNEGEGLSQLSDSALLELRQSITKQVYDENIDTFLNDHIPYLIKELSLRLAMENAWDKTPWYAKAMLVAPQILQALSFVGVLACPKAVEPAELESRAILPKFKPSVLRSVISTARTKTISAISKVENSLLSASRQVRTAAINILSRIKPSINASNEEQSSVSFLWYPRYPKHLSMTHVKIRVDDEVFGTMVAYKQLGPIRAHTKLANKSVRHSFFRFDIRLSSEELTRLRGIVQDGASTKSSPFCVNGACKALNKATLEKLIPFPFNQAPSTAAMYLTTMKALGNPRIGQIQFVGKSAIRSIIAPDLAAELLAMGEATYFIGAIAINLANSDDSQEAIGDGIDSDIESKSEPETALIVIHSASSNSLDNPANCYLEPQQ